MSPARLGAWDVRPRLSRFRPSSAAWWRPWVRAPSTPQAVAARARLVLAAAEGMATSHIARDLGLSRPTVRLWRQRFADRGPTGLTEIQPGRGRKPQIPAATIRAIVAATLHTTPPGATHWSCRSMARAQGVSPATVQRIWDAHGLKPHRVRTFKSLARPGLRRQADRCGRAVPEPAGSGGGLVRGREEPDSSAGSHATRPAHEAGPGRHHDP